jgi:hypothetical protein
MRGVRGDSKLVGRTLFNRYRRRRQMWTRRWAIRLELAAGVCVAAAAATCGLEFWPTALALACMLVAAHVGGCAQQVLRRCWCYTASVLSTWLSKRLVTDGHVGAFEPAGHKRGKRGKRAKLGDHATWGVFRSSQ